MLEGEEAGLRVLVAPLVNVKNVDAHGLDVSS